MTTPRRNFSSLNERLMRLRYPLYAYIIGGNVAAFLLWNFRIFSPNFMLRHFALSKENLKRGRIYTLLTFNFSHTSPWHLLSNSIGLYFVGRTIESIFGPRVFLTLFMAGGLIGGLLALTMASKYDQRPLIGSSAGLSALLGFFVLNFPKEKFFILPIPIPIPGWLFGLGFLWYSWRNSRDSLSSVSHAGHLGGFLTGVMYFFIFHNILAL